MAWLPAKVTTWCPKNEQENMKKITIFSILFLGLWFLYGPITQEKATQRTDYDRIIKKPSTPPSKKKPGMVFQGGGRGEPPGEIEKARQKLMNRVDQILAEKAQEQAYPSLIFERVKEHLRAHLDFSNGPLKVSEEELTQFIEIQLQKEVSNYFDEVEELEEEY